MNMGIYAAAVVATSIVVVQEVYGIGLEPGTTTGVAWAAGVLIFLSVLLDLRTRGDGR